MDDPIEDKKENHAERSLEEELADDLEDLEEEPELLSQPKVEEKTFTPAQIKSYIAILTSALGGVDHTSDIQPPPYKLGHEALLCLQDIKKWLRTYDNEKNSWAVAVACAESGLVNDLITILALWEETLKSKKNISGYTKEYDVKIAKLSLELLIVLTWPIELSNGMYKEQLDNYLSLKKHQLSYKKNILTYKKGAALKAIIQIAIPILELETKDRRASDSGILRFCITFFRNILAIEPAGISKVKQKANHQGELNDNLPRDVKADDVSIGACITAFEENMVFVFLLTVSSSLGEEPETRTLSEVLLESIYYLTRKLRPHYIMSQSSKLDKSQKTGTGLDLSDLLQKEKHMKSRFQQNSSSRHGRFGSMFSLQTSDMGRLTVSGGSNILSSGNPLDAIDSKKKWYKTQRFKYLPDEEVIFPEVTVGANSRKYFHDFVCDFIDGVLNPFMKICTKHLTGDEDITKNVQFKIRYLSCIAWFLEALRLRSGKEISEINYSLVGNVLSEEAFRLVFKFLRDGFETPHVRKQWGIIHAGLLSLKEMLYIVDSMSSSNDQIFQDISTGIKERLFHIKSYVTTISNFPKEAIKRAPEFTETCVELINILFKTLENYTKEDLVKVIKDKKSRKTKKNVTLEQSKIDATELDDQSIKDSAEKLQKTRQKDYKSLQSKFINQGTVNMYVQYISRWDELSESSIKMAIKFLHLSFFEHKRFKLLYRLDFLYVIHSMLSDQGLASNSRLRNHVLQFLNHYMKKLRTRLDDSPVLFIEILFPDISDKNQRHYLDTGEVLADEKAVLFVTKEAFIRNSSEKDLKEKVSIMVASLIDDGKVDLVQFLKDEMERVLTLRMQQLQYDKPPSQQEDNNEQQENNNEPVVTHIAIKSNVSRFMNSLIAEPEIRYLLKLAEFRLPQESTSECIFKKDTEILNLNEVLQYINMFLISPVSFENDKVARDFIIIRKLDEEESVFGGDYDDKDFNNEDELYDFEETSEKYASGYNDDELDEMEDAIDKADGSLTKGVARSKNKKLSRSSTSSNKPNSKRRLRKQNGDPLPMHELSEDESQPKAHHQEKAPISSMFIVDSDDESDDESDQLFFAREKLLRQLLIQNNGSLTDEQIRSFINNRNLSEVEAILANTAPELTITPEATPDVDEAINTKAGEISYSEDIEEGNKLKRSGDDLVSTHTKKRSVITESDSEDDYDDIPSDDNEKDNVNELRSESESETEKEADDTTPRADFDGDINLEGTATSTTSIDEDEEEPQENDDEEGEDIPVVRRKVRVISDDEDE